MLTTHQRYSWTNQEKVEPLFISPSEETVDSVRLCLRKKIKVKPTSASELSLGDTVVIVGVTSVVDTGYGDGEGANAHSYIGEKGVIDSMYMYGCCKPDLIVLRDEALFLENFLVKRVYS